MTISSTMDFQRADESTPGRPATGPYRPIQYLGNKLRVIDEIVDATTMLIGRGGRVADLFTGTTVVAQALAQRGYSVTAVDTQSYAEVFANTMLGIHKQNAERVPAEQVVQTAFSDRFSHLSLAWSPLVEKEKQAIRTNDYEVLQSLYSMLPLIWRDQGNSHYRFVYTDHGAPAFDIIALITSIYAGSYFGLSQALTLDRLRQASEILLLENKITNWQYNSVLTAILSSASSISHTAGKHFAQPLQSGASPNVEFLAKRLLADRRISVLDEFSRAAQSIDELGSARHVGHNAQTVEAEEFVARVEGGDFDLFYIDPPYTAQQYSRFYHVLETIVDYKFPKLITKGITTTGLYPEARYKSAFSSRRRAATAFETMLHQIRESGASALISYSESEAGSSGNARMIDLDRLLKICSDEFGGDQVECRRMVHRYRQFNSSNKSNTMRSDPEILILCKQN